MLEGPDREFETSMINIQQLQEKKWTPCKNRWAPKHGGRGNLKKEKDALGVKGAEANEETGVV